MKVTVYSDYYIRVFNINEGWICAIAAIEPIKYISCKDIAWEKLEAESFKVFSKC